MHFLPEIHPRPYRTKGKPDPGRAAQADVAAISVRHRELLGALVAHAKKSGQNLPRYLTPQGLYVLTAIREDLAAHSRAYDTVFRIGYWADKLSVNRKALNRHLTTAAKDGVIVYFRNGRDVWISFLAQAEFDAFRVAENGSPPATASTSLGSPPATPGGSPPATQPSMGGAAPTGSVSGTEDALPAEASSLGDSAASLPSTENGHDPSIGHVLTTSDDIERRIAALDT